ncbi:MAG: hypothetical protein JKY92_01990 [Magnetovibrio sp.]|nr:hypothetical protein [Magnetovibrio sp.]
MDDLKKLRRAAVIQNSGQQTAKLYTKKIQKKFKTKDYELVFRNGDILIDRFFKVYLSELDTFKKEHKIEKSKINHPKISALSIRAFQELGADQFFSLKNKGKVIHNNAFVERAFSDFAYRYTCYYLRVDPRKVDPLIRRDFHVCMSRNWKICTKWGSWAKLIFVLSLGTLNTAENSC